MSKATYRVMSKIPTHVRYIARSGARPSEHPVETKWSHPSMDVPALDTLIYVRINQVGLARVTSYFVEDGYLGVMVQPIAPPEWYVKQNGRHAPAHFFGSEVDPAPDVPVTQRAQVRILKDFSERVSNGTKKRYTAQVRNGLGQILLDGREERTTPELALKLANKFCTKNALTIYSVEFPS